LILLGAVVAISGVFSAFLVNDAICLVLTPLVLEMTLALGRQPVPYLLAVAMASNVGSTATITGNPQNIMIGSFSHIPYAKFALTLGPVALVGLIITGALIALHRAEFTAALRLEAPPPKAEANRVLVIRALVATLILIALFLAGAVPAKAAIIIGGLLLLTRRVKSHRVYAEIDWSLLLMFAGLFIIVAGAERTLLSPDIIAAVGRLHLDQVPVLSTVTAVLSNLVSNVPAVLMLKPFVDALKDHDTAWLTIAMASTLAGNFTVPGLDRQSDRRAEGGSFRRGDRPLGLFQGRCAIDHHHPCDRDPVAVAVAVKSKTKREGFSPLSLDAVDFLSCHPPASLSIWPNGMDNQSRNNQTLRIMVAMAAIIHPPKRMTCFPRYILSSRSMRTTTKMATKGTSAWGPGVIRGINAPPIIHIALSLFWKRARPQSAIARISIV
jgi:Citrate transporter